MTDNTALKALADNGVSVWLENGELREL